MSASPTAFPTGSATGSATGSGGNQHVVDPAHNLQQQTARTIHSIMFGRAFDEAAWRQIESFASEKAREMRTERLKRGTRDVGVSEEGKEQSLYQPRKLFKMKRK